MSKKQTDKVMLSEHVFEARYPAVGSFLDIRGYVADYIKGACSSLQHWRISENTVDFFDSSNTVKKDGAFVGYKNAGYIVLDSDTHNYFGDKARNYWETLSKSKYFNISTIQRLGVRTKVFIPLEVEFEKIHSIISDKLFKADFISSLGGESEDMMATVQFKAGEFTLKCHLGPMHKNEAKGFFKFESDEFEKTGLYFDIDCFKNDIGSAKSVGKDVVGATNLTWEKVEHIASWLGF